MDAAGEVPERRGNTRVADKANLERGDDQDKQGGRSENQAARRKVQLGRDRAAQDTTGKHHTERQKNSPDHPRGEGGEITEGTVRTIGPTMFLHACREIESRTVRNQGGSVQRMARLSKGNEAMVTTEAKGI